jgi:hypothetical protein
VSWHDKVSVCFPSPQSTRALTLALARNGWAGVACQTSRCCCTYICMARPSTRAVADRSCMPKLWLLRRPVTEDGEELMGSILNTRRMPPHGRLISAACREPRPPFVCDQIRAVGSTEARIDAATSSCCRHSCARALWLVVPASAVTSDVARRRKRWAINITRPPSCREID